MKKKRNIIDSNKKKKVTHYSEKFGRPSCSETFNAEYRVYIRGRIEMRDMCFKRKNLIQKEKQKKNKVKQNERKKERNYE